MAKRRRRKKKHNIRNCIIAILLITVTGIFGYVHIGGEEAKENLVFLKSQAERIFHEASVKTGLEKQIEKVIRWAETVRKEWFADSESALNIEDIPEYAGAPFVEINQNIPQFDEVDFTLDAFEKYSPLDFLGRCKTAYAMLGRELMPDEERESISEVTPSGWINKEYEELEQKYLYNRCHLIGFQLAGENANERNLITGTRYLNVEGMLPLENQVASYIKETGNHVLYRVTPIYEGRNLVASGVEMEAQSVEDNGEGIQFHVYCYNVQPGIEIDYSTGESRRK